MIQNDRICRVENIGYLCDRNTGDIYSYNFENAVIRLENNEKSESKWYRKYRFCLNRNNKLYCIPDRSQKVKVYDLENQSSTYISLGDETRYSILDAWIIGDILWLVSFETNGIIEVNLKCYSILNHKIFDDNKILCGYKCDLYKNIIYIAALNSKKIVEFNLETKRKRIIELNIDEKGFSIVLCKNGYLYLTGQSYNLYRIDCKNHSVEKVGEFLKEKIKEMHSEKGPVFIFAEHIDEDMVFIPSGFSEYKNCIFYVNCGENLKIKKYDFNEVITEQEEFMPEYVRDRFVGLYGETTSNLYEINVDTGKIVTMQNHWETDSLKQLFKSGKAVIERFSGITLIDYIKVILEEL